MEAGAAGTHWNKSVGEGPFQRLRSRKDLGAELDYLLRSVNLRAECLSQATGEKGPCREGPEGPGWRTFTAIAQSPARKMPRKKNTLAGDGLQTSRCGFLAARALLSPALLPSLWKHGPRRHLRSWRMVVSPVWFLSSSGKRQF